MTPVLGLRRMPRRRYAELMLKRVALFPLQLIVALILVALSPILIPVLIWFGRSVIHADFETE